MNQPLQDENKPAVFFVNPKEELWLNLSRTAAAVGHEMEQRLRPFGISSTQYNVLRILRSTGAKGLPQCDIRERLVAQVPDVPRILERMEKAGWIARMRGETDRRMQLTVLTEHGRQLVEALDQPMGGWMEELFERLSPTELDRLNDLLTSARMSRQ